MDTGKLADREVEAKAMDANRLGKFCRLLLFDAPVMSARRFQRVAGDAMALEAELIGEFARRRPERIMENRAAICRAHEMLSRIRGRELAGLPEEGADVSISYDLDRGIRRIRIRREDGEDSGEVEVESKMDEIDRLYARLEELMRQARAEWIGKED